MVDFFTHAIFITGLETILGLLLALILSVPLIFLIDHFKTLKLILEPVFVISQAVPFIILAPFLVLLLGFGFFTKVAVVALASFFAIVMAGVSRLATCHLNYLLLFKSLGASSWQTIWHLKLLYALAGLAGGLKIASSYAVGSAIIAESLGSNYGLGVVLMQAKKSYDYGTVAIAVLLIVLMSLLFFMIAYFIEKYLLKKWGEI